MNSDIAINIKHISKEFHLAVGKEDKGAKESSFFALKDISFALNRGDALGIIGSNGSGKTTLLKILSQITKPTEGEVHFYGSSTSILDIGSNFHPDLSGRKNVGMQLKIAGIDPAQFDGIYEKIKEFSEIGAFFDHPVKLYSSGMFLRLAFSIAFHLSSDILILDEVLSVGDEGFRLKCQELLRKFIENGKTILFVSHNRAEILELSNKCMWLEKGQIRKTGEPYEVLSEYFAMHRDNYDGRKTIIGANDETNNANSQSGLINMLWSETGAPGNDVMSIRELSVKPLSGGSRLYQDDAVSIRFRINKKKKGIHIGAFFFLQDVFYQPVLAGHFLNNTAQKDLSDEIKEAVGLIEMTCVIPAHLLMPGKYFLLVRFGMEENQWNEYSQEAFRFSEELNFVINPRAGAIDYIGDVGKGSVRPPLDWDIKIIPDPLF